VRIDLYQDGPDGPALIRTIADRPLSRLTTDTCVPNGSGIIFGLTVLRSGVLAA
jgi:hypothetical protein